MKRSSGDLFLFFLLLSLLPSFLSVGYIEHVDCDEKISIDQALIKYRYDTSSLSTHSMTTSTILDTSTHDSVISTHGTGINENSMINSSFSLYGTNHICYKCSKTLIANEQNQCALLFSPHPYRLYILDNETQQVMTKRDYTFGEHGIYTITYNPNTNKMTIDEDKEPVDSLRPLMDLLTVIIVFTFFLFLPTLGL